jgi:hypothetical protein
MHKKAMRLTIVCVVLSFLTPSARAGISGLEVIVSDSGGQLVHRGKTDSTGAFATRQLPAGNYVVQFRGRTAAADRNDYAFFVAGAKHRVVADAVEGSTLTSRGVAMRLKLAHGTPIVGQAALGGVQGLGTKIVNGRRYILVPPETGTAPAPRWVEEGTQRTRNLSRISIYADDWAQIKQGGVGALH